MHFASCNFISPKSILVDSFGFLIHKILSSTNRDFFISSFYLTSLARITSPVLNTRNSGPSPCSHQSLTLGMPLSGCPFMTLHPFLSILYLPTTERLLDLVLCFFLSEMIMWVVVGVCNCVPRSYSPQSPVSSVMKTNRRVSRVAMLLLFLCLHSRGLCPSFWFLITA